MLHTIFFGFWMVLFGIGALGCAITIPIVAFKFFSVLFEKDAEEQSYQEYEVTPLGTA
jgi:hypothetical protein